MSTTDLQSPTDLKELAQLVFDAHRENLAVQADGRKNDAPARRRVTSARAIKPVKAPRKDVAA